MPHRDQLATLWTHVAESLKTRISPDAWARWFSSVSLLEASDVKIRVAVPDSIHQLWIEMNYMAALKEAFEPFTASDCHVKLEIDSMLQSETETVLETSLPSRNEAHHVGNELNLSQETKQDGDIPIIFEEADRVASDGLTPNRTFETFVAGTSNQFSHAAALAVASKPAKAYNPLFLYGGSGLGKTHLMQAIGARVAAGKKGKAKIVYITSEEFTNQFIYALQTSSIVKFRKRFRQADVLLIDDIHFLAGKERSQEEFFHTFNALLEGHRQIVLSSDRPPSEIKNLENRLVTRFEWGLAAEMTPPDEETRVAILRKKAELLEVEVPGFILNYLAEKIRSNVRRLHGALVRVASWISLHGQPITLQETEHLLRDLLQQESRNVMTIDRIQKRVAEHFDIRLADMCSRKRPANIAFARQVAMYLARDLTQSSYQEIGTAFGGRDHGTIMHACRTVEAKMIIDDPLRHAVAGLQTGLRRVS